MLVVDTILKARGQVYRMFQSAGNDTEGSYYVHIAWSKASGACGTAVEVEREGPPFTAGPLLPIIIYSLPRNPCKPQLALLQSLCYPARPAILLQCSTSPYQLERFSLRNTVSLRTSGCISIPMWDGPSVGVQTEIGSLCFCLLSLLSPPAAGAESFMLSCGVEGASMNRRVKLRPYPTACGHAICTHEDYSFPFILHAESSVIVGHLFELEKVLEEQMLGDRYT